jgi:hypothetical protein
MDIEPGEEHGGAVTPVLKLGPAAEPGTANFVGLRCDVACMLDLSSTHRTTEFRE